MNGDFFKWICYWGPPKNFWDSRAERSVLVTKMSTKILASSIFQVWYMLWVVLSQGVRYFRNELTSASVLAGWPGDLPGPYHRLRGLHRPCAPSTGIVLRQPLSTRMYHLHNHSRTESGISRENEVSIVAADVLGPVLLRRSVVAIDESWAACAQFLRQCDLVVVIQARDLYRQVISSNGFGYVG